MKHLLLTLSLVLTSTAVVAEPKNYSKEQKEAALEMQESMEKFANHLGQLVAMDFVLGCELPVGNLSMTYGAYTQSLKLPENVRSSLSNRVGRAAESLVRDQNFEQNTKEQMDCKKGEELYVQTINHLRSLISK